LYQLRNIRVHYGNLSGVSPRSLNNVIVISFLGHTLGKELQVMDMIQMLQYITKMYIDNFRYYRPAPCCATSFQVAK